MNHNFCVLLKFLGFAWFFVWSPNPCYAASSFEEASTMRLMCEAGLAESAASQGQLGMRVSAGASRLPAMSFGLKKDGYDGLNGGQAPALQRIWITRGLMIPVNIGLSLANLTELNWLAVTGFVQWSVYEAFARPVLALRMHLTNTYGLEQSQLSASGVEAVVSYGFLRYFAVFGSIGINRHQVSVRELQPDQNLVGGVPFLDSKDLIWTSPRGEVGFQMTIFPGIAAFTYGYSRLEASQSIHTAKVSVAL